MNEPHFTTIDQVKYFLKTVQQLKFGLNSKAEKYRWLTKVLIRFAYRRLSKKDKGIIKKYLAATTGYSNAQLKRLIKKHYRGALLIRIEGKLSRRVSRRVYTPLDIGLLVKTDAAHEKLSGPATKHIFEREFARFNKSEYERLAEISISHLYNLRATNIYKSNTSFFQKTNPTKINIGERKKPAPYGRPGFIRMDTVHQGDKIGLNGELAQKGVYHINSVCEVTQWEIAAALEKITEQFLLPILLDIIRQYPFNIFSFHADNGSEYINHQVAGLLGKLLIRLTKSRPRQSNDNALAETKNNIIRKHFGYVHIPQPNAALINQFYQEHFNNYLNYHRPCGFAAVRTDRRGKQKKVYPYNNYQTPYERLRKIPQAESYLKANVSFDELDKIAYAKSDNEFAEEMMKAKREMFKKLRFDLKNDFD